MEELHDSFFLYQIGFIGNVVFCYVLGKDTNYNITFFLRCLSIADNCLLASWFISMSFLDILGRYEKHY